MPDARRLLGRTARGLGYLLAGTLLIAAVAVAVLQTDWSSERLRRLVVSQANQYLTATLAIGRLEGSLVQGITLRDVELSRDDQVIVKIDEVAIEYRIGELFRGNSTSIRNLRLVRPRIVAWRESDRRW